MNKNLSGITFVPFTHHWLFQLFRHELRLQNFFVFFQTLKTLFIMKKVITLLSIIVAFVVIASSCGGGGNARKEAKRMAKEGWKVPVGSQPIEAMLEKSWAMQEELDQKGQVKYITSDGNAIGGNRNAAEAQAIDMAKFQLAGLLETRIAGLVSQNVANTELSDQEAESVSEMVQNSKNIIAQEIGYVRPIVKMFRRLDNGNVEVSIKLFYNAEEGAKMAKKRVRKELKEKLKTNEEDLRKLMGM